jgi:ferredoxin-NADP reductase
MQDSYSSRLTGKVPRVADIVSFRLERPKDYQFQAGQWFVVTFVGPDPAEPYEHHFSHSDAPSEPWLEFTTRLRQSEFKNALSALPIGSDVQVEGPYGSFVIPPEVERAAFLAGGIGITCVRSILRWVAHVGPPVALREMVLFFANHSEDAIPFAAELEGLAATVQGLRVVHVLSHPGESWQGYRGHMDQAMLAAELPDPASWHYFVSGPPSFDQAMHEMLVGRGIAPARIKTEPFEGY